MNHCVFFTDLALKILEKDQSLATAQDAKGETALHVLARKPSTIANTSQLSIWKRSINSCKSIEPTQKSLSKYHVPTLERVGQIRLFWVPLHLGKNTLLICHSTLWKSNYKWFLGHRDHVTYLRQFKSKKCSILIFRGWLM